MTYATHRPTGISRKGDSHLPGIVQDLRRKLAHVQRDFAHDTLRIGDDELGELAGVLVDFAEDLHNDIGLWAAYERYNVEFYGTPLPLTSVSRSDTGVTGIHPDRVRHLLWILYPAFIAGLTLSPTHTDLSRVADIASAFLRNRFTSVPRESGVQAFLRTPNEFGWDVKRKLIWLGTHSHMFRTLFANYVHERGADAGQSRRLRGARAARPPRPASTKGSAPSPAPKRAGEGRYTSAWSVE